MFLDAKLSKWNGLSGQTPLGWWLAFVVLSDSLPSLFWSVIVLHKICFQVTVFLSHNKTRIIVVSRFDLINVFFHLLPNTFCFRLFLGLPTKFANQLLWVNKFLLALLGLSSFSIIALPFFAFLLCSFLSLSLPLF